MKSCSAADHKYVSIEPSPFARSMSKSRATLEFTRATGTGKPCFLTQPLQIIKQTNYTELGKDLLAGQHAGGRRKTKGKPWQREL